jgi:hypothetical protein
MNTSPEAEAAWLRSLSSEERARFLAWLSHNLTVAVRLLKHSSESAELRLEQLYEVNEIQHRVSSYIGHALGTNEDTGWLLGVAARVLEPADAGVKRETTDAWARTRKNFVSAT